MSATREAMLACIDRELNMRERVYPRWIDERKMSIAKAREEIATMRDIRARIAALPETQANLFAPPKATTRGRPTDDPLEMLRIIVADARDEGRADMRDSVDEMHIEHARQLIESRSR